MQHLNEKIVQSSLNEGDVLKTTNDSIMRAQSEINMLKSSLVELTSKYEEVKKELQKLQNNFSNLESGHAEIIRQEQKAAQERADIQRQQDLLYANEIREKEYIITEAKQNAISDLQIAKEDTERQYQIPQKQRENILRQLEEQLDKLSWYACNLIKLLYFTHTYISF
jgi:hypothetical protein